MGSDTRPAETSANEQGPFGGDRLGGADPNATWRAFGLEHRGLEAKQAQISQQFGHALVIERGLGRAYAELDLPSNADLAFGAGLAEAQEADHCRRNIFTQALDLCGQPAV